MEITEAKTCEERVLAELGAAEKKVGELENGVKYANAVLGVLQQICVLEENDKGQVVFRGVHIFDKEKDADLVKLLGIFAKGKIEAGSEKK